MRAAHALRRSAIPLLCALAGAAAGWSLRAARVPGRGRVLEVREGARRFVNPLIACEQAGELVQTEELAPFQRRVAVQVEGARLRLGVGAVSLYFRELNDGLWFEIGGQEVYTPASLRKVPMLLAVLKQAETDPGLLDRAVPFALQRDHVAGQTFPPSQTLVAGRAYSVAELLERMIVFSDNNAFMLVASVVDPRELERVLALAELPSGKPIGGSGEFRAVRTYATYFRILYNASYLGADSSDRALALLAQTEFRAGLVAGVPPDQWVAHKFGEHRDDAAGTAELHDCGIVYFPRHPYLLCVMTRGTSFEALARAIASTSQIVHDEVARGAAAAAR